MDAKAPWAPGSLPCPRSSILAVAGVARNQQSALGISICHAAPTFPCQGHASCAPPLSLELARCRRSVMRGLIPPRRTGAALFGDWPALDRSGIDDPDADYRLCVRHSLGTGLVPRGSGQSGVPSEFPCIFPLNRKMPTGDRFATDCVHHHPVSTFPLSSASPFGIAASAAVSRVRLASIRNMINRVGCNGYYE